MNYLSLLGLFVSIKTETLLDKVITGIVLSYDKNLGVILLEDEATGLTIVKASLISNIEVLSKTKHYSVEQMNKALYKRVDSNYLRNVEMQAIRLLNNEFSKINSNVSPKGQAIFNALSKTLPCKWKDTTIVVFGDVYITSPYNLDNLIPGNRPGDFALVKKVFEGESLKILQKQPK